MAAEPAQARNRHLALLTERGEAPWQDAEELISRCNQPGHERADTLMIDLGEVAHSRGAAAADGKPLEAMSVATIGVAEIPECGGRGSSLFRRKIS